MAEINVQTKKNQTNMSWVWILLALLVIGAVVYYLATRDKTDDNRPADTNKTSWMLPKTGVEHGYILAA